MFLLHAFFMSGRRDDPDLVIKSSSTTEPGNASEKLPEITMEDTSQKDNNSDSNNEEKQKRNTSLINTTISEKLPEPKMEESKQKDDYTSVIKEE